MSDEPAADMTLLTQLVRRVIAEQATARDDMGVMMAILQRIDGTMSGLVNEVRAMHSQHSRLDRRVRDLEAQP